MGLVLGVVAEGGPLIPERLDQGLYLAGHWSIEHLTNVRERWKEKTPHEPLGFQEYGVCDNPEQAVEKLGLRELPERFFVTFVKIRRADQPADGGWRWHKWGPYIGDKTPTCEYLHDELEIDEVYTFHVYEPAP
jgi:hypothetical protein